jgi:hypothetical protein
MGEAGTQGKFCNSKTATTGSALEEDGDQVVHLEFVLDTDAADQEENTSPNVTDIVEFGSELLHLYR